MHVRTDRKALKDGTKRNYVSLVHNVWEEGPSGKKRAKPIKFANLGAEDDLDIGTVRSMRDALDRYLQRRLEREGRTEAAVRDLADPVKGLAPTLKVLASREYGMRVIVEHAWKKLGLDRALDRVAQRHDLKFDLERVVFGMVLNRVVDPQSKRACNEWLKDFAWFPEAEEWQVHHFYRALDVLDEHADQVIGALRTAVRDRLSDDELELLLIDTTSSYYESDYDDRERAAIAEEWAAHHRGEADAPTAPEPQVVNDPPLRLRGHSKDHRPEKPQIVIGVVGTTGGRLLGHKVYPGNRNDQTITLELLQDVGTGEPGSRPVAVMDSGMGGGPNLAAIDALPGPPDRVSAVPIRNSAFAEEAVLSRPGRWRQWPDKPHFQVRVVAVAADESPSGRAELWIATRNAKAADRAKRKLHGIVGRIRSVLEKDNRLDDHNREVCRLLSNGALKRYIRPSKDGRRLLIDRARVQREERMAGVKVIRSTLVDKDPLVSLRAYESLLSIESGFRAFKTPLKLRPMHHRSARRIRAHVLVCALALACMQELEASTGRRFDELRRIFGAVQAVRIQQGHVRYWQRGEWSADASDVLGALGLALGSVAWGTERVEDGVPDGVGA